MFLKIYSFFEFTVDETANIIVELLMVEKY
jgi:hypothetical protein